MRTAFPHGAHVRRRIHGSTKKRLSKLRWRGMEHECQQVRKDDPPDTDRYDHMSGILPPPVGSRAGGDHPISFLGASTGTFGRQETASDPPVVTSIMLATSNSRQKVVCATLQV